MEIFKKLLDNYRISLIHIHHLLFNSIYWIDLIKTLDIPYIVTLHDFYPICPRINMVDRNYNLCSDLKNEENCNHCLQKNELGFNNFKNISEWRSRWETLLIHSKKNIAPSLTTANIIQNIFPKINIDVIEHGLDIYQDNYEITSKIVGPEKKVETIRVGIIGAISIVKGSRILENIVLNTQNNHKIEWVIIGYTDKINNPMYDKNKKLIIHGKYNDSEVRPLLDKYSIDVVLFPAIWPETFSYTLSEVLAANYPVIVPNLGALGERTKKLDCGWVIDDFNEQNIVSFIEYLSENPSELKFKKDNLKKITLKSCELMGKEYIEIYQNLIELVEYKNDIKLKDEFYNYIVS